MTRTVVFRPEADEEATEVHRWYEAKRLGLGDEFGAEVDAAVARIIEYPQAYPVVQGELGVRCSIASRMRSISG